jgi:hypothetical protein
LTTTPRGEGAAVYGVISRRFHVWSNYVLGGWELSHYQEVPVSDGSRNRYESDEIAHVVLAGEVTVVAEEEEEEEDVVAKAARERIR